MFKTLKLSKSLSAAPHGLAALLAALPLRRLPAGQDTAGPGPVGQAAARPQGRPGHKQPHGKRLYEKQ